MASLVLKNLTGNLLTHACLLSRFRCVSLFVTPWTVARQAPLSRGFSRQQHWSGLPCPPPGDLPHPRIETRRILYCLGCQGSPQSLRPCRNLRAFSFTFPRHSRLSAELKPCPGLQMVRHQHGVLLYPSLSCEPMSSAPVLLLYSPLLSHCDRTFVVVVSFKNTLLTQPVIQGTPCPQPIFWGWFCHLVHMYCVLWVLPIVCTH